jgi:hypothetical protein
VSVPWFLCGPTVQWTVGYSEVPGLCKTLDGSEPLDFLAPSVRAEVFLCHRLSGREVFALPSVRRGSIKLPPSVRAGHYQK